MSASQTLGRPSRCSRALGPSLDKIVKNAAWRKHSHLVSICKSVLDKLQSISDSHNDLSSPLLGVSHSDAEFLLNPLILALDSAYPKVAEPALECAFKLFSLGLIRGEIHRDQYSPHSSSPSHLNNNNSSNTTSTTTLNTFIISKLIDSVCRVCGIGEEAIELPVLRVLLAAVRSPCTLIRGECLLHIVRTCYNVYLGGLSGTHQICAKSVLAQIMLIVFTRAEEDSLHATVKTVSVSELLEFTDKNLNEGSSIHFAQNFVNEVMAACEGDVDPNILLYIPSTKLQNGSSNGNITAPSNDHDTSVLKAELSDGEAIDGTESIGCGSAIGNVGESKIMEDGFLLFRNLCKLSMKISSQENPDDQILLRGKILSLELLKVVMHNGGPIWCINDRFLSTVKQYLCLSLLKNSALSVMAIFQLQCSIFMTLLSKFRSGLKAEIGIFFPMLVLRVLENVNQPSFLQKMTVLSLLEEVALDPQLIIDIFVNYDCDVDAPNIYERMQGCWSLNIKVI